MLLLLLFLLALYVIVAVGLLYFSRSVIFPLGNEQVNEEWFWPAGGRKLLLYLQGNAETPLSQNRTIAFFLEQGWDVVAGGYSDSFEVTERDVLRRYESRAGDYPITAIFARSLGTCFAPMVCRKASAPNKIQFVIYATPVTSVGELANWHSWSLFRPFTAMIPGYDRGMTQHNTTHRYHIIIADNDSLTPKAQIQSFTKDKVDDRHVHVIPLVGHNELETSAEYLTVLRQIVLEGA